MACDSLLTTSLLQVVNRLVATRLSKLVLKKVCCKLFQQVVTSLQVTSCNKPDLTCLLQLDEIHKLLATCSKIATSR